MIMLHRLSVRLLTEFDRLIRVDLFFMVVS